MAQKTFNTVEEFQEYRRKNPNKRFKVVEGGDQLGLENNVIYDPTKKERGFGSGLLWSLSAPFRKTAERGRTFLTTLGSGAFTADSADDIDYESLKNYTPTFVDNEEFDRMWERPVLEGAKDVANVASYAIAPGAGSGVKGAALAGAQSGLLQGFGSSKATDVAGLTADTLKGGAVGGAVGGALGVAGKGLSKLRGKTPVTQAASQADNVAAGTSVAGGLDNVTYGAPYDDAIARYQTDLTKALQQTGGDEVAARTLVNQQYGYGSIDNLANFNTTANQGVLKGATGTQSDNLGGLADSILRKAGGPTPEGLAQLELLKASALKAGRTPQEVAGLIDMPLNFYKQDLADVLNAGAVSSAPSAGVSLATPQTSLGAGSADEFGRAVGGVSDDVQNYVDEVRGLVKSGKLHPADADALIQKATGGTVTGAADNIVSPSGQTSFTNVIDDTPIKPRDFGEAAVAPKEGFRQQADEALTNMEANLRGLKTPKTPTGYYDRLDLDNNLNRIMEERGLKDVSEKSIGQAKRLLNKDFGKVLDAYSGQGIATGDFIDDAVMNVKLTAGVDEATAKALVAKQLGVNVGQLDDEAVRNATLSVKNLATIKRETQKAASNALSKSDKTGIIGSQRAAALSEINNSASKSLGELAPETKPLLRDMAMLYEAAPDIVSKGAKGNYIQVGFTKVPVTDVPKKVALKGINAVRSLVSSTPGPAMPSAQGTGRNLLSVIGGGAKSVAKSSGRGIRGAGQQAFMDLLSAGGSSYVPMQSQGLTPEMMQALYGGGQTGGGSYPAPTALNNQTPSNTISAQVLNARALELLDAVGPDGKPLYDSPKEAMDRVKMRALAQGYEIDDGSGAKVNKDLINTLDELERLYQPGTDKSLAAGGTTVGPLGVIARGTQRAKGALSQDFADRLKAYEDVRALAVGVLNQARGAGTLNEGEYQVLVQNMPNQYSSEKAAQDWFDNVKRLLATKYGSTTVDATSEAEEELENYR